MSPNATLLTTVVLYDIFSGNEHYKLNIQIVLSREAEGLARRSPATGKHIHGAKSSRVLALEDKER